MVSGELFDIQRQVVDVEQRLLDPVSGLRIRRVGGLDAEHVLLGQEDPIWLWPPPRVWLTHSVEYENGTAFNSTKGTAPLIVMRRKTVKLLSVFWIARSVIAYIPSVGTSNS